MIFKLMTSQVVQRARPLITYICVVGIQRVNLYSVQSSFKIILGYAVVMVTKVLTFMRDGS